VVILSEQQELNSSVAVVILSEQQELNSSVVVADAPVRYEVLTGGEFSVIAGGGDLAFQAHFYAPPTPLPEPEPQPEPKTIPLEQLGFWPRDRRDRAPVWLHQGYARGLAHYVQYTVDARGGSSFRGMQSPLPLEWDEVLAVIRYKRQKVHKRDIEAVSSPADCGRLWYGNEDMARPCGCDDKRVCSFCGVKEADRLGKDACDFLYEEFLEAVKPVAGRLQNMGSAWELPLHKGLSAKMENLMAVDFKRYQKEANKMLGEMWEVIQLAYPEGKIGGHQSLQLYGESNPGEAHFHGHHVVAPVVLETAPAKRSSVNRMGVVSEQMSWAPIGAKPLPGFIAPEVLEELRFDWGRRQVNLANRLGVPLSELGVEYAIWDIEWVGKAWEVVGKRKPVLEGDVHLQYFGFKRGYQAAIKAAKGYLGYQARWPGKDLVGGLRGDGRHYTWTGPMGSKPKPEVYGEGASFTGRYTKGGHPLYERDLSPADVARAIWRLDKFPAKFPRLRWRGFLSTGNMGKVMDWLDWEQVKPEPEEEKEPIEGELLQPVGRYKAEIEVVPVGSSVDEDGQEQFIGTLEKKIEGGLRFEAVSDGLEVRVPWSHLRLGPVGFNGEALVKGRSKVWVKKIRDGPDDA